MTGWGESGKNWYFLSEKEQMEAARKYLDDGGDVNATDTAYEGGNPEIAELLKRAS